MPTSTISTVKVNASILREALAKVLRFRSRNAISEIMQNVLVTAADKTMNILAVSPESSAQVSVECNNEIAEPSRFCVNPEKLLASCGLGSVNISIDIDSDGSVFIAGDRGTMQIASHDPDTFPEPLRDEEWPVTLCVNSRNLTQGIKACLPCTGVGDRYALSGVAITVEGNKARMSATDGRQACSIEISCDVTNCDSKKVYIVPGEFLRLLPAMLSDEVTELKLNENKIKVISNAVCISQLLEGLFPDVQKILADFFSEAPLVSFLVIRDELVETIRLAVSGGLAEGSGVEITVEDGDVTILSRTETDLTRIDVNLIGDIDPAISHGLTVDPRLLSRSIAGLPISEMVGVILNESRLMADCLEWQYVLMGMAK